MEKWEIVFSKRAEKDWEVIKRSAYRTKAVDLLDLIETDPFGQPPPVKQLVGDMKGVYSRRINHQHRLVYTVDGEKKTVRIIMMWLHYE